MAQNQNVDTTFTKIYVSGLPWTTREEGLINFFQRFGEIIHANVVCDRATHRSKGYGFVTFKDAESATRACMDPNPTIDGRIANCRLASSGANVRRQNQSNLVALGHDDLCYTAPSFWQNMQPLHQPLTTYAPPHWNQFYWQQYLQQWYNYPQHYNQYNPQYDMMSYQHYSMVNTYQWYSWPHQATNVVNGESSGVSATARLTEVPSTSPGSSSAITINATSDSGSDGNKQLAEFDDDS